MAFDVKKPYLEKITLNIGVGQPGERLDNAEELLKRLTEKKPVRTLAKKRVPAFGIRPGLPIGVKVTLRGKAAEDMLKRLLTVKKNALKEDNFDKTGNVSFGIHEYIDVPGVKYDPALGMFGFDVAITLIKRGYRVARRKIRPNTVGKNQRVSKDEAMTFMQEAFKANISR